MSKLKSYFQRHHTFSSHDFKYINSCLALGNFFIFENKLVINKINQIAYLGVFLSKLSKKTKLNIRFRRRYVSPTSICSYKEQIHDRCILWMLGELSCAYNFVTLFARYRSMHFELTLLRYYLQMNCMDIDPFTVDNHASLFV